MMYRVCQGWNALLAMSARWACKNKTLVLDWTQFKEEKTCREGNQSTSEKANVI